MSEPHLLASVEDGVAVLTLNQPTVRNAYSGEMGRLLAEWYRRADEDDDIRCVVVTGTPPAFCAGADMSSGGDTFRKRDESDFSAAAITMPAWDVRKPVIAAVNGHAIGIGFTLTLQCDIRIYAADAKYGVVQVRRGVMPDGYSTWTLPRIAGFASAADVLLTGRTFDGHEAERLGIGRCLPNDEVLPAALDVARDIAVNTAPVSVALTKQLLWRTWDLTPAATEAEETQMHHILMGMPDAREGVMAYLERRDPRWTGKVSDL